MGHQFPDVLEDPVADVDVLDVVHEVRDRVPVHEATPRGDLRQTLVQLGHQLNQLSAVAGDHFIDSSLLREIASLTIFRQGIIFIQWKVNKLFNK